MKIYQFENAREFYGRVKDYLLNQERNWLAASE